MKRFRALILVFAMCLCTACGSSTGQEIKETEVEVSAPVVESKGASFEEENNVEKEEPITLTVYSQLSGYEGIQQGWFAQVMLDADAGMLTYEDTVKKLESSGYFFSPVEYAGSLAYNTEEHTMQNMFMASLVPREAEPAAFGMSITGGNRVWAMGAGSEHKELCMEILNWFCTPEGVLTGLYGPKGVCWDYDAEGNTYFTELGKSCYEDRVTIMPKEYGGSYFGDGCPQINNSTWAYNAQNPESNGETYNAECWKSNLLPPMCVAEQNWQEYTGASTTLEYMQGQNCVVIPEVPYVEEEKSETLQNVWEQVSNCIVSQSWEAVYAPTQEEYDKIVAQMITSANACGYELCLQYGERQAAKRFVEEERIRALVP